ncbi:MAG: hypothetical protein AB1597_02910 [Chloroflexota bacterium]
MPGPKEPFLKFGLICEKVLVEKDNVLTIVRIIDRFEIMAEGQNPPEDMPPTRILTTFTMAWVGGLGSHSAAFSVITPTGEVRKSRRNFPFHLDTLTQTHSIVTGARVNLSTAGTYWLEFLLNDVPKGRIPFLVVYKRQQTSN